MRTFYIKVAIYFVCFLFCLFSLDGLDFKRFIKQGKVAQAQLLYFIVACIMAYLFGNFLISIIYFLN